MTTVLAAIENTFGVVLDRDVAQGIETFAEIAPAVERALRARQGRAEMP
jgi:acyl carrier protein